MAPKRVHKLPTDTRTAQTLAAYYSLSFKIHLSYRKNYDSSKDIWIVGLQSQTTSLSCCCRNRTTRCVKALRVTIYAWGTRLSNKSNLKNWYYKIGKNSCKHTVVDVSTTDYGDLLYINASAQCLHMLDNSRALTQTGHCAQRVNWPSLLISHTSDLVTGMTY